MHHIFNKEKIDRKYEFDSSKFCILEQFQKYGSSTVSKIIFKSAMHGFRPNLIHSETIEERSNPKYIKEGEIEHTHILSRLIDNNILILLEKHQSGISIKQFITYLNNYTSDCFDDGGEFSYSIEMKDNFLEEIAKLDRVSSAEIIVDKQILGGEALNFSTRTNSMKHNVTISVKAYNKDSIVDFVKDVFAKLNGGRTSINRISLKGRNTENNEVILNTELFERQEYIHPTINIVTGELSSSEIFIQMKEIIEKY